MDRNDQQYVLMAAMSVGFSSYPGSGSQYIVAATPEPTPVDKTRVDRVRVGTRIKWYSNGRAAWGIDPFVGEVTAKNDDSITMSWGGALPVRDWLAALTQAKPRSSNER